MTIRRVRVGAPLLLAAVLAACAAEDEPAALLPPTDELRIGLTEWSIATGPAVVLPGDVQLVVTNTGGTVHDLVVHGEQGSWRTPVLEPGQRHVLDIRTESGELLHLDCSVTGHHTQGMHTSLPVAGSPGGPSTP